MKFLKLVRYAPLVAALGGAGRAQTRIDLATQTKSVNFSAATSTLPSQTGAVLPATCLVGATFILTTSIAGQNWYICTSANTWTLQGNTLPSQAGNSGALLSTNGASLQWSALAGDISGAPGAVTVNRLLGRKLNTAAPSTGQLLGWDGSQWSPQTITLTIPVPSVFGRTGAIAAQNGDYSFSQISGTVSASQLPQAGGDLSGSITSAIVARVQGMAVASTAPSPGQVMTWSGSQWAPQNPTGGGSSVSSVFGRTGAVTAQAGDYSASQITNAVNAAQSNSYPAGARQTFSSSTNGAGLQLAPGPLPSNPLPGDLAVDSGDSNRLKLYDGASWDSLNPSVPPSNYTVFFSNTTVVSVTGATHGLGTGNLIVQCYDGSAPANMMEPSQITVDPVSYNVIVTFPAAQSGRCVLNGYNGSGSSIGSSGAGMASQLGDLNVVWASPSTLSIGANCSAATPCNVRFGTQVFSIAAPATATITGGAGVAYIYVDPTGALDVGGGLSLNCVSCVVSTDVSGFPVNSVPIFTWTASNGAWVVNGGLDRRGFLSASPVMGGPGIATVSSAGQTTVSVDSAVVPTYLTASATLSFPTIPAGACAADLTFALPGANPGDAVAPGWPASLGAGLNGLMRISAGGIVSVRLCADATGAANPPSATYTATVLRGF